TLEPAVQRGTPDPGVGRGHLPRRPGADRLEDRLAGLRREQVRLAPLACTTALPGHLDDVLPPKSPIVGRVWLATAGSGLGRGLTPPLGLRRLLGLRGHRSQNLRFGPVPDRDGNPLGSVDRDGGLVPDDRHLGPFLAADAAVTLVDRAVDEQEHVLPLPADHLVVVHDWATWSLSIGTGRIWSHRRRELE